MPRWVWFAPFGLLVVALALWAFRWGWIAATISETDVIETWTSHYVAHTPGGRATDCTGQPGRQSGIWILVSCVHAGGQRVDYPVDRFGRLRELAPKPQTGLAPET
jgi:hypothetical protein